MHISDASWATCNRSINNFLFCSRSTVSLTLVLSLSNFNETKCKSLVLHDSHIQPNFVGWWTTTNQAQLIEFYSLTQIHTILHDCEQKYSPSYPPVTVNFWPFEQLFPFFYFCRQVPFFMCPVEFPPSFFLSLSILNI